jgi:hypothetical protein
MMMFMVYLRRLDVRTFILTISYKSVIIIFIYIS